MFGNFAFVCISLFGAAPSNNANVSLRGGLHLQEIELFVEPASDIVSLLDFSTNGQFFILTTLVYSCGRNYPNVSDLYLFPGGIVHQG